MSKLFMAEVMVAVVMEVVGRIVAAVSVVVAV